MKRILLALVIVLWFTPSVLSGPLVLRVDQEIGASGDGSTWGQAINSLDTALFLAVLNAGDTEIWVKAGVYTPTLGGASGDPQGDRFTLVEDTSIYGGFAGDELSISERDPATNLTILSGDLNGDDDGGNIADNTRHVVLADNVDQTAILDGFIIERGVAQGGPNPEDTMGGGMLAKDASPIIRNCVFRNCDANSGGGAISIDGSPRFESCEFSNNTASEGGGLDLFGTGLPTVVDCLFIANEATTRGGGLYAGAASMIVGNCRFFGNTSPNGGGMQALSSVSVDCFNSVFSGNTSERGGAVSVRLVTAPRFHYCTFANNAASEFGGAFECVLGGALDIRNSILWDNSNDLGSPSESNIYLQSAPAPVVQHSDVEGGWAGAGNMSADPRFVKSDGWDGLVGTRDDNLRTHFSSPVRDQAIVTGVMSDLLDLDGDMNVAESLPFDLLGNPRVSFANPDMGAYEYSALDPPVLHVVDGAAGTGASWAVPANLDDALDDAQSLSKPLDIWITKDAYTPEAPGFPFDPRDATFDLPPGVSLVGGFDGDEFFSNDRDMDPSLTVLTGDLDNNDGLQGALGDIVFADNAYHVVTCNGPGEPSALSGITIRRGNANDPGVGANDSRGGGVLAEHAALTIDHCAVDRNRAMNGAGIAAELCELYFRNSMISSNVADDECGGGALFVDSSVCLKEATLSNNDSDFSGGAFEIIGGHATVERTRFLANSSDVNGGAVAIGVGASMSCVNSEFSGNSSTFGAAFVQKEDSNPLHAINCSFTGNVATVEGGVVWVAGGGVAPLFDNSILFGNPANGVSDEEAQIDLPAGYVLDTDIARSSLIEGWTGALSGTAVIGGAGESPVFVDADGPDDMAGTEDDDLRLGDGSDAIDAATNVYFPGGVAMLAVDLAGADRFIDAVNYADSGVGVPPIIDMGAHEAPFDTPFESCPGDFDGSGDIGASDLAQLLGTWGQVGVPADFFGDGVGSDDLADLLGRWGPCS